MNPLKNRHFCSYGVAGVRGRVGAWNFARPFTQGIIGGPTGRKGGGVARFFRDRGGWGFAGVRVGMWASLALLHLARYGPCVSISWASAWPRLGR